MNPYKGIAVKSSEILLFYPLHSIINYQHINYTNIKNTIKQINYKKGFYNGIKFQLMYLPINRFIDLQCYKDYNISFKAAILCSTLKAFTYPLNTFEIYYKLHGKYPKIKNLYNGYGFYFLSNTTSYIIWFNCLEYFNNNINIESNIIKNFCVGFISGIIVDIAMNPLRVIKTNLQNNISFKNIFNKQNIIYRGLKTKLILSALQSSYFNVFINLNFF